MKNLFVYITTKNQAEALKIGRHIVEQRLAACANILPSMTSLYHWQGQINQDRETVLILKTQQKHFAALKTQVMKLHSYECPCIIAMPIKAGFTPYMQWIVAETSAKRPKSRRR